MYHSGSPPALRLFVAMANGAVAGAAADGVHLACLLRDDAAMPEDELERHWQGFLRLHNLFQFLPLATFTTSRTVGGGTYRHVPAPGIARAAAAAQAVPDDSVLHGYSQSKSTG